MKIFGIMPEISPYSPRGGPVSVWCREVYEKIGYETEIISNDAEVKSQEENVNYLDESKSEYFVKQTLRKLGLEKFVSKFTPYNLEHISYSLKVGMKIPRSGGVLHIQNRPEYVPVLKMLHPSSKILLHSRNNHLSRIEKYWGRIWSKIAVTWSDGILGNSKYMVSEINDQFPSVSTKTRLLYNATNEEQFYPRKNSQSDYEIKHAPEVLFVGRLTKNKGVHLLVESMKEVIRSFPEAKLTIVGSSWFNTELNSDYYKFLKNKSEPIRDHIKFTGYVPHSEIPSVYRSADVCVVPSICNEAFGVVVCESMATGLPTIVTDRGGPPEVVGEAGIIVNPEEISSMAQKIVKVLSNPSLAYRLGRKARRRIERKFTWDMVAQNFTKILKDLFGDRDC